MCGKDGDNGQSKDTLGCCAGDSRGKSIGQKGAGVFYGELQAALAQVLAEADGDEEVIKAAMNALMARRAN